MTKMTAKGQVTLPKRLRDRLGLKPGSSIDFELADDGEVVLRTHEKHQKGRLTPSSGALILA
jgi:antitoxin PrlF